MVGHVWKVECVVSRVDSPLKKTKNNSLLPTRGFVDLQEAMWSSLLMRHG